MRTKEEIRDCKRKREWEARQELRLASARAWKAKNKDKVVEYRKAYWQKNKHHEVKTHKIWLKNNPDFKIIKAQLDKEYRHKNKDKIRLQRSSEESKTAKNKRSRDRYRKDLNYNIEKSLRAAITQAMRLYSGDKKSSVDGLIGCTVQELKNHLESKFKPGMNWSERKKWHTDHIIPVSSFDLTKLSEQKKCFHYSNLQPLWASDNIKKGSKLLDPSGKASFRDRKVP